MIKGMLPFMPSIQRSLGVVADDGAFDGTNRELLFELQRDARLSLAERDRRVGLSPPAVAERLQRLEREGVIRGYRAEIDPAALGYGLSAIIRGRPMPRPPQRIRGVGP